MSARRNAVAITCSLVLVLVVWEVMARASIMTRLLVSSPYFAARYALDHGRILLTDVLYTMVESAVGLAIGASLGAVLASIGLLWNWVRSIVLPLSILAQTIPLITLAPFLIIALGTGIKSKIAISMILCFFPVHLSLARSFERLPSGLDELLECYGPSKKFRLVHVYWPLALPLFLGSLRVAATLAVVGAVVGEFTGAEAGLGRNLFLAAKRLEPDLMVASVACVAIVCAALLLVVRFLDHVLCGWYKLENLANVSIREER